MYLWPAAHPIRPWQSVNTWLRGLLLYRYLYIYAHTYTRMYILTRRTRTCEDESRTVREVTAAGITRGRWAGSADEAADAWNDPATNTQQVSGEEYYIIIIIRRRPVWKYNTVYAVFNLRLFHSRVIRAISLQRSTPLCHTDIAHWYMLRGKYCKNQTSTKGYGIIDKYFVWHPVEVHFYV